MTAYASALAHLWQRSNAGMKLDLAPMRELLGALGNPHRSLRCVVVGGTNGKGSTAYTLARACQHAGLRTGLYTSPHLLRFSERIQVDAREISRDEVATRYDRISTCEHVCSRSPTFFECATAIALTHFCEQRVDIAILEVGLGGRLDATNVVDKTLAVLTPISLDHTAILGNSAASIAWEKAHILPPGGIAVCAPQPPDARACIESFAHGQKTRLWHVPTPTPRDHLLSANGQRRDVLLPRAAPYVWDNLQIAWNAWCALKGTGIALEDGAFDRACHAFSWPGRYQWIDSQLLIDCAHNVAGIAALVQALTADPRVGQRPVHCVFSTLSDKDAGAMLQALQAHIVQMYVCPVSVARSRSRAELARLAPNAQAHPHAGAALDAARAQANADGGVTLVTGSIFLVADILRHLRPDDCDPAIPL